MDVGHVRDIVLKKLPIWGTENQTHQHNKTLSMSLRLFQIYTVAKKHKRLQRVFLHVLGFIPLRPLPSSSLQPLSKSYECLDSSLNYVLAVKVHRLANSHHQKWATHAQTHPFMVTDLYQNIEHVGWELEHKLYFAETLVVGECLNTWEDDVVLVWVLDQRGAPGQEQKWW